MNLFYAIEIQFKIQDLRLYYSTADQLYVTSLTVITFGLLSLVKTFEDHYEKKINQQIDIFSQLGISYIGNFNFF